ncbi:catalase family peroxidase [Aliidiomarina quisquiliarum]|uniref:catalase family peroxidase n=1 Tax=Aliidiomarina quisquiliarum TaxID=2938947 RepID=UPI00208E91BA|nr:catalase family peroxidase [Aliidiomarina quisquiliarum]MCO4321042.1 catalase family peroxidase [Aliidiomarina quisquiliarum]
MTIKSLAVLFVAATMPHLVAAEQLPTQPQHANAQDLIEVFEKSGGKHPGIRKGHAKGVCAVGEFVGSEQAALYTNSLLFSGATIPAVMRFSMAGQNPIVPDSSRSPRGLGVKFSLPNGGVHHIAMLSTPMFGANSPESFLGLMRAGAPDEQGKRDPARVAAYRAAYPDTQPQADWLMNNPIPRSYKDVHYYGVHTFFFKNEAGVEVPARYSLEARDGYHGLDETDLDALGNDFLAARLQDELATAPAYFDYYITLAEEGDNLLDPSQTWPEERERVLLGTLKVTTSGGEACTPINFDPNIISAGVRSSDDAVLKIRSPAYAISFARRLTGK